MQNKRLQVVVTAFGPFLDVLDNPSDYVRKAVLERFGSKFQVGGPYQHYEVKIFDSVQLAVEDDVVLGYIQLLREKVDAHRRFNPNDAFVIIHFGVNAGLNDMEVQLERRCFNGKCFTDKNVPVRGGNIRIDDYMHLDHDYRTSLPINAIFDRLRTVHPYLKLSDNPGRYLCNYI